MVFLDDLMLQIHYFLSILLVIVQSEHFHILRLLHQHLLNMKQSASLGFVVLMSVFHVTHDDELVHKPSQTVVDDAS